MKTPEYLDLVRMTLGVPSDYALQKPLGVTKQQLSRWRTGADSLSDAMAVRVAELTGVPAERVLVDAHIEKAKTPEEKAVWTALMEKISKGFETLLLGTSPRRIRLPAR